MTLKLFYRFILIPLLVIIVTYFIINPLTLTFSYIMGDYPGPEVLVNQTARQKQAIDWLLIHGASADARVWRPFLDSHCGQSFVAISLGQQEIDPSHARPGVFAGQELTDFLNRNPVQKGIIAHSTGALWLAQAYHDCPECFQNLKIILLAPSSGDNAFGLTPNLHGLLLWGSILAPDPYASLLYSFGIETTGACVGGDKNDYPTCRAIYNYGRQIIFTSYSYYLKLTDYMNNPAVQEDFRDFLKQDAKNITIYVPGDDHVLFYDDVQQLAQENKIKVIIIPNISHEMILARSAIWFQDATHSCTAKAD